MNKFKVGDRVITGENPNDIGVVQVINVSWILVSYSNNKSDALWSHSDVKLYKPCEIPEYFKEL